MPEWRIACTAMREWVDAHRADGHQVWYHNRGPGDYHIQCFTCWPMRPKEAPDGQEGD